MTHNAHYTQAYSPAFPHEEEGEWVWVPKKTITPNLTITHQSPTYRPFCAGGSESQGSPRSVHWDASCVSPTYTPEGTDNDIPSLLDGSPSQPLLEGFDQALDINALLADVDPSWAFPAPGNSTASANLFANWRDVDWLSGLDIALARQAPNPLTPPGASPSSPVYGTILDVPNGGSPPLLPLTPISLPTPNTSPASTSPVTPAPPQLLACSDASCTKLFSSRPELRKHERRHRQPFRCPLPACGKGHLDRRALHRHLWAQHPAYARQNGVDSEKVQCPHCEYAARGDNVARHVRSKHAK